MCRKYLPVIIELNWTYFIDISQKDWTQVQSFILSLLEPFYIKAEIAIQKC